MIYMVRPPIPFPRMIFSKKSNMLLLLLLLLCSAISCSHAAAAPGDVVAYSFPVIDSTTADGLTIARSLVSGSTMFAGIDDPFLSKVNESDGFVVLSQKVDLWRGALESSFSTSFTMITPSPVEFVVLFGRSSFPTRNSFRMVGNSSFAAVEFHTVEYYPVELGLHVSVTPYIPMSSPSLTVWIDYYLEILDYGYYVDVAVRVAPVGETKNLDQVVHFVNTSKSSSVTGFNQSHQTAFVGFYTASIRNVLGGGIRGWDFTVKSISAAWKTSISPLMVILLAVLGSVVVAAVTAAAVVLYFNSKYRRWKKDLEQLAKSMQRLPGMSCQIDFADIKKATSNFHSSMELGSGAFGSVYRCKLPAALEAGRRREIEAAVKKFTRSDARRYDDFLEEVSIINRLRHRNIVPLIGWSYHEGEPLVVFELMRNGSLDQHLFHERTLQWSTRYAIVRDIATGLHYVHHEYEPAVLHRDIKASNVLLDSTFRARLGDFGIACTVALDRNSVTGLAGTRGYIAPEYACSYRATRETDIYAFGVVVLEIVTGKRALYRDVPSDGLMADWVWRLRGEGKLLDAVDDVLEAAGVDTDEAGRLLMLGLACTSPNPSDRPSMADVLQVVTKLAPPPDVPLEKPTFVWPPQGWRPLGSDYCSTETSDLRRRSSSTVAEQVQEVRFQLELMSFMPPEETGIIYRSV